MFCTSCGFKIFLGDSFCTNCGKPMNSPSLPLSNNYSTLKKSSDFEPIFQLFKKNYWLFIALLISVLTLTATYFIFVYKYPQREANKIIKLKCDCYKEYNDQLKNKLLGFSNKLIFNDKLFASQSEAYDALNQLQNPSILKRDKCLEKIDSLISINIKYWEKSKGKQEQFYTILENDTTHFKFSNSIRIIEEKLHQQINMIKSARPNVDIIKNNIIGFKIMNQKIESTNQIKSLVIISENVTNNEVEYTINLNVNYFDPQKTEINFNNVRINYYLESDGTWKLSAISCNSMDMNFWVDNIWHKILLPENCSYSFSSNGFKGWVKDNSWFASNKKIGPDITNPVHLDGNTIYFASRESDGQRIQITLNINKN